jgi:hypothetical protein
MNIYLKFSDFLNLVCFSIIDNIVNGLTVNYLNEDEIDNTIISVLIIDDMSTGFIFNDYKSVHEKFDNLRMVEETINIKQCI